MSAILTLNGVRKAFGAVKVAEELSYSVPQGEALGVLGPNGAGKTSMFNLITGALTPDAGRIEFRPPYGCGGVEGLRDGHESDLVAVEDLHQLGEVHQRAAETIDLVDHDDVDQPVLDIGDQLLERGPVQPAAQNPSLS